MTRLPLVMLAVLAAVSPAAAIDLRLREIARVPAPVAITHAGDHRLFITLQDGQVMIHDGSRVLPTPFLDISNLTNGIGERGLLSVAFHPRYQVNGFFFVYYTDAATGDIVIARYSVSSDPNRANPSSGVILLTINHRQFGNHNGGQLQFGPDGYLYIGTGDGGGGGDPLNSGQRLNTLLGKLLRIDVDRQDGTRPYAIPSSNPFTGHPTAHHEIWAYGLRNPWRFSFDRLTDDLFIADVGQNHFEEIDFQPASSAGGENYGWNRMEAAHCYPPGSSCSTAGLVPPIHEYGRADGSCSVTGGFVYRGLRSRRLRGVYVYGDLCSGKIWGLSRTPSGTWSNQLLLQTSLAITSFGEDVNGELYVADHNGRVFLIEEIPSRRRAVRR